MRNWIIYNDLIVARKVLQLYEKLIVQFVAFFVILNEVKDDKT